VRARAVAGDWSTCAPWKCTGGGGDVVHRRKRGNSLMEIEMGARRPCRRSSGRLVGREIPWIWAGLATREAEEAGGASARPGRRTVTEEETICSVSKSLSSLS
jgi:hypothetical protein